jgi:surface polysaccharide O-acyltransferase-like enzyme
VAPAAGSPGRIAFLDQIRTVVTLLVVFHHTAITYGGPGSWYYHEAAGRAGYATTLLLALFCAVNQAFFMGMFFLLAGYVTPPAYDRKGALHFLRDRAIRLGIPLLLFGFVLDALTNAIAEEARHHDFWLDWITRMASLQYGPGPLWFVQALLILTVAYVVLRRWRDGARVASVASPPSPPEARGAGACALPRPRTLVAAACATAIVAFVLRLRFPTGDEVFHMQLGYFASYLLLFAVGCIAWRHRWLERIDLACARPWAIAALVAIPLLPLAVIGLHALRPAPVGVSGGFNLDALLYAAWEPCVAWGVILMLLWFFRLRVRPERLRGLARRAYAIYCFHPPVVVAMSVALRSWLAPPVLKFLTVGSLSCAALYVLTGLLLRLPGFSRVF